MKRARSVVREALRLGYGLFLLGTLGVFAFQGERVDINGFASQGYLNSSHHNYLARTIDGTFEFNEVALNITGRVHPRLRLGMQIFARDLGEKGDFDPIIDWAYGDWLWRDELSVRLGKIKTPLGFYNQSRDVDLARPTVFLPQSAYPEEARDLILAFQGINLYGNLPGDIDYELSLGNTSLDSENAGLRGLTLFVTNRLPFSGAKATNSELFGTSLRWNTPLEGLALGISTLIGEIEMDVIIDPSPLAPQGLELDKEPIQLNFLYLSLEYQYHRWSLSSEYGRLDVDATGNPVAEIFPIRPPTRVRPGGWYAQAAYRLHPNLELSITRDVFYTDLNDRSAANFVAAGLPPQSSWQKDWVAAARIDITPKWVLKVEGHLLDGYGLVTALDAENLTSDTTRDWHLLGVKATFHF